MKLKNDDQYKLDSRRKDQEMLMNTEQAEKLKSDFNCDGVVLLHNFIPSEQIAEICRRAENAIKGRGPRRNDMFSNVTKGMEKLDDYFGELLNKGSHLPILEMLLGKKPEPTTASFFTKVDNTEQVHPHSDALDGGVIWIALDQTTNDNGCMHFLKGSHHVQEEYAYLKAHEPNDLSDHPDRFEASMSPGDIVFFRPTTVHWSGPNYNGTPRRGFNCFYTGDPWNGKAKMHGKGKGQAQG